MMMMMMMRKTTISLSTHSSFLSEEIKKNDKSKIWTFWSA